MKNDSDEDSLPSLLAAVNGTVKTDIKTAEDALKMRRIIENSKTESKDLHECSAVLDFSLVSAAFQYYRCQKNEKKPLDTSSSSSNMWDNSYAIIQETDCTQPLDSTNDLEKTLSDLQMDTDLISEWPKFKTEFLNMFNFFDEQMESSDSFNKQSTIHETKMDENEVSNPTVVNFEIGLSDSKGLCNDSSESAQPETDYESFETRSAASKSTSSSSQYSENTGEERPALKRFHIEGFFPEELDYEPSEAGETEAKESDNEFCIDNPLKEKESGSFSHYCSHVEVSENSTFQKKIEETAEEHAETCDKQDFISFFENNFEPGSSKNRLQDNYDRYFEYEEEDDSESDSEHSFKRNSSRNRQVNDLETLHPPSINSDVSKVRQLNSINEVMLYICEQCKCGSINEAIAVANRYIAISVEDVQLEIFKELFINVIDFIKSSVFPVDDVRISNSLGEIMDIFQERKLFNSDLCSLVISECFGCDHAIKTGKEFFSFIQKIKVPINSNAISSYVDIVMPSEIPSLELISFMEYVKYVCNLPCPKTLLCEALGRFSKQEEGGLPVGFFRLCKFLCSVSSKEVDINHLRNFIKFCIKNDNWTLISNFFQAWCNTDGHLISCLAQSFLFRPEDVGLFYEKLAEEIFKHGDASLYLVGILGQIGVSLMLEVFSQKQYESAFGVVFTLHKHNINYLELQAGLYNAPSCLKSVPNFGDLFVFPFTVAFAALDICLHLERFRDAYRVFKSFSLHLPADMDDKLKLKVRSRRLGYLLKLAQELFSIEPLKLGLQAFHDICSASEDFSLEELEDFAEEIQAIYNKYLTYVVNGCQLHTALELFECSEGVMKEIFIIHPRVLRGLLVTFAQNDKMGEAYKFFSLGCEMKVYNIEQTETEEFVWCLTVMSSWTIFEVEFVIETFIKNICLAWDGKHENEIDMQLSVKIVFKESEEDNLEIDCLKKSHSIDSAKEIVCNVLQSLDSDIKWIENQNPVCLELVFETIYNYCINKSPNFLWRKKSRKNLLEDVRPNAEFKIQLAEEDSDFKYSTESNSVKSLEKVLDPLTPEYSVADSSHQLISDSSHQLISDSSHQLISDSSHQLISDSSHQLISDSSHQLISDQISHHSLTPKQTLPESCQPTAPETAFLENSDHQFSDLAVSRSIEQEQIISSSNQLSPAAHSSKTTCPTPDEKLSEIDASENIPTNFCSESADQAISEKNVSKVCNKMKVFKSLGKLRSKKKVSKTVKHRKKCNRVLSKSKPVSKNDVMLPPGTEESLTETKKLHPGSSNQSKPCIVENLQITLGSSAKDRVSRLVSLASEGKLSEPKNTTASVLNVPETVFQKIVLFLRSKVLLKCKDLQPQQQQEKANHLATRFIQSNAVGALDKKTMKLLSEFSDGCV